MLLSFMGWKWRRHRIQKRGLWSLIHVS
jgi:hypothetical protein